VVISSNAKKDLSDPFLGRCVFHHIAFPTPDFMRRIITAHFPDLTNQIADATIAAFYNLRDIPGVEKKPATRELLHWTRALTTEADFNIKDLSDSRKIPLLGLLFKKSDDLQRAQRTLRQTV